jgi:hypothetical protein
MFNILYLLISTPLKQDPEEVTFSSNVYVMLLIKVLLLFFCSDWFFIYFVLLYLQFNALIQSHTQKEKLVTLIEQKEIVGDLFNQLRLALQRRTNSRPAQVLRVKP